jgi:hypothetical protein
MDYSSANAAKRKCIFSLFIVSFMTLGEAQVELFKTYDLAGRIFHDDGIVICLLNEYRITNW